MSNDYIALRWVKEEISETLQQARQSLEAHCANPSDISQLKFCMSYLHQIQGTLDMVEFFGAALLAKEMEAVAEHCITQSGSHTEALDALMHSILQLPNYLDSIKVGRRDLPVVLLPSLNSLRKVRGLEPLTEHAVFDAGVPDVALLSTRKLARYDTPAFHLWLEKLTKMVRTSIEHIKRQHNAEVSPQYLLKAFGRLHNTLGHTPHGQIWLPALALSELLNKDKTLFSDNSIALLDGLLATLESIKDNGVNQLNKPVSRDLSNGILLMVAASDEQSEYVSQAKNVYNLSSSMPSNDELEQTRTELKGPDKKAVSDVVDALEAELETLKEQLDVLQREQDRQQGLKALQPLVSRIAGTLQVLGLEALHKAFEQIQKSIQTLLADNAQIEDDDLFDIAGQLLYVEASLTGMQQQGKLGEMAVNQNISDAHKSLLFETRNILERVKENITDFINQRWDEACLSDVPSLLNIASNSIRMIPIDRVANMTCALGDYIGARFIGQTSSPSWQEMDLVADVLSGCDYFIERHIAEPNQDHSILLDRAEQALELLQSLSQDEVSEQPDNDHAPDADSEDTTTSVNMDSDVSEREHENSTAKQLHDDIDEEIIEVFLEEAEEVKDTLLERWPVYKANNDEQEALTDSRRAFHTLKGSGRMVKAEVISELAWSIENMLNRVLDHTIEVTADTVSLVDKVIDSLPQLIDDFRTGADTTVDVASLREQADALIQNVRDARQAEQEESLTVAAAQPEPSQPVSADAIDDAASDKDLRNIFDQEAEQHLDTVRAFVAQAQQNNHKDSVSDDVQRALHTLKGSARMAGFSSISDLAAPLEKLVKELLEYYVPNSPQITELLSSSVDVMAAGITRQDLETLSSLEGSDECLEKIKLCSAQLIEPLKNNHAAAIDPNAIRQFLVSGMDSLLEADQYLHAWSDGDNSVLQKLYDDLKHVEAGAEQANIAPIQSLAECLAKFYVNVMSHETRACNDITTLLGDAHESLLEMMDHLAAGQSVKHDEAMKAQLSQWMFEHDAVETETSAPDENSSAPRQGDEIFDIFMEEAEEISEKITGVFNQWQSEPDNLRHVDELQRELHTLKGGALVASLNVVADLCHELESVYEHVNRKEIIANAALFEQINTAHNALYEQLDALRSGEAAQSKPNIVASLHAIIEHRGVESETASVDSVQSDAQSGAQLDNQPSAHVVAEPEADGAEEHNDNEANVVEDEVAPEELLSRLDESDFEILDIFLEEFQELNESLEQALRAWENELANDIHCEEMQRVLHTIKGGARLAKLSSLGDFAHAFETDIQQRQEQKIPADDAFIKELNQKHAALIKRVDDVQVAYQLVQKQNEQQPKVDATTPVENVPVPAVVDDESNPTFIPTKDEQPKPVSARVAPQEMVRVSSELLDNLVNLAGETSIGRGRLEQEVVDFTFALDEMNTTIERLRDQLRRLDMETEAQVLFSQERQGPDYEDFDPLEMDRYSTIQQLSRGLVESASDLSDLRETLSFKARDVETLLLQQSRINTELQEGLMKSRMVPFQQLVPRLRRVVRQVSLELDKKVELLVKNAEGEMDRTVLERLISPLEHMVRNAVDHGIESTEERASANKNAVGHIVLSIQREGGDIVLSLRDDGQGINSEAIRKKAIERGLLSEDQDVTDHELMQFILKAGFSTAEKVTQISGRGVGLDVVSNDIKNMGGSVEILSEQGQGTEFIVRLPFTVSVNRALMVKVGDDLYAIPLNNIQGIVRVPTNELQYLYKQPDSIRRYDHNDASYPLSYLGNMLGVEAHPKIAAHYMPQPVLLIGGAQPFALHVDELLSSKEVVVKALGPQFASLEGVSGGTILGDGSVVIILDVPAMIRQQSSLEYQKARVLEDERNELRQDKDSRTARILVVDDSVTVRKVTSRLLERNGFDVLTSKDGVDAMATMQDHRPDLILLDIEMPRMDGFEVASLVRHDERLQDIPIIMITSRTGDKHRERADALGVDDYMGKPFQEEGLLNRISELLDREAD